jgi:hypothetical protein
VFQLLWDAVSAGKEMFAYVINRSRNGDHYWVFAHVTPSTDAQGRIVGYHSNRRVPKRAAIEAITPIYRELRVIEAQHRDPKAAMAASVGVMSSLLQSKGMSYDQFVFSI